MKKAVFFALSTILFLTLCACNNSSASEAQSTPETIASQTAPTVSQATSTMETSTSAQTQLLEPTASLEQPIVETPVVPSLIPQEWESSEAFKNALTSVTWIYTSTLPTQAMFSVSGYEDIATSSASERTFLLPDTLHSVQKDGDTIIKEYDRKYLIEDTIAYVSLGEYQGYIEDPDFEVTDPMPEMRMVYYIDSESFLIQELMVYSYQTDLYTLASDANIYSHVMP